VTAPKSGFPASGPDGYIAQTRALCRKCPHKMPGCRERFNCRLKVQTTVLAWTDDPDIATSMRELKAVTR
jgi:hypothetical protein